jgi:DUF4097 and DUF4098 domain-containing protein YvlB
MLLTHLLTAALAVLPQGRPGETDTTFSVPAGTRLSLESMSGSIVIKAWDRPQVRLQASHSSRTTIRPELSGTVLTLRPSRANSMTGMGGMVDYELTVPATMGIEIEGMFADVTLEGTRGDVKVEAVEGDIKVTGGDGTISLTTIDGEINVRDAKGRLELHAVSDDITVTGAQGEVTAEAVSGDIVLRGITGRRVDAQTVSGDVEFEGTVRPDGSYVLSTHSGDVTFALPEGAGALITAAISSGDLEASFTLPASERASRRRQTYRFGAGGASVELETFSGDVRLVRPSEMPARKPKEN